jgi:hypothetical protein
MFFREIVWVCIFINILAFFVHFDYLHFAKLYKAVVLVFSLWPIQCMERTFVTNFSYTGYR